MGRTLHYYVTRSSLVPSDEECEQLDAISQKYRNSFHWTCEEPQFDYYDFYPNWNYYTQMRDTGKVWDIVTKEIEKRMKEVSENV